MDETESQLRREISKGIMCETIKDLELSVNHFLQFSPVAVALQYLEAYLSFRLQNWRIPELCQ